MRSELSLSESKLQVNLTLSECRRLIPVYADTIIFLKKDNSMHVHIGKNPLLHKRKNNENYVYDLNLLFLDRR